MNIDVVNDQFLFRDALRFTEYRSDGNGTHLEEYYYIYGTFMQYSDSYRTISMTQSDDVIRVKTADGRPINNQSTPGFETALLIPAVLILVLLGRKSRRQSRP